MRISEDWKSILLVALTISVAVGVVVIISQNHKITEARYNAKQYESKIYDLEVRIEIRSKKIKRLEKELKEIKTDGEIIDDNPIDPVTADDTWADILRPIATASDSFQRNRSRLFD